ncbi:hypothetical protein LIER_12851 [Lithospermum erythrorhizon]|uniref:Uncharacterized protein n=1 Tax=Lithospermum erythrorhizon TaxID=34254 RepID=A0AAV3PVR6_LITER
MAEFSKKMADEATQRAEKATQKLKVANPAIVENYRKFIQGYNEDWFTNCNLDAPLTPEEEDEEEAIPPGAERDNAQAS